MSSINIHRVDGSIDSYGSDSDPLQKWGAIQDTNDGSLAVYKIEVVVTKTEYGQNTREGQPEIVKRYLRGTWVGMS
jgi:hypothetical protein